MTAPLSAFPPPPANASTCPKCNAPATPSPSTQTCPQCGRLFLLRACALMDASITAPPPDPKAKELKLKAPGLVLVSQAVLKPDAIGFGTLDPIIGAVAIDEKGARFAHLYSVAVWRELNVMQVVLFTLVSLPIGLAGLGVIVGSKFNPVGLVFGGLLLAMSAYHGVSVFKWKATRLRVLAFKDRALDITFIGRQGKRQKFIDELFRRSGLPTVELP